MSDEEVRSRLRAFIARVAHGHAFEDDDDVFALGLVTSMFALELVTFVESSFGLTIETEDLELDNFRTVAAIAGLVGRKSGDRMAAG
jgi:acyl carrier protein